MTFLDDEAVANLRALAIDPGEGERSVMPGSVVADRFEVRARIGEGGMGIVVRAFDRVCQRDVALKVAVAATEAEAGRFEREAGALAGLDHSAIVRYVAHGKDESGRWLAMELVDGPTLSDRLRGGPLSIADALALGRRVAEALAVAHARGLVHRDVKPSNVVLERGDPARAVLVDFGLARDVGSAALTATGTIVGTPWYIAPEQVRTPRAVDGRADLFALGASIHHALVGRPPFVADDTEAALTKVLLKRRRARATSVPTCRSRSTRSSCGSWRRIAMRGPRARTRSRARSRRSKRMRRPNRVASPLT